MFRSIYESLQEEKEQGNIKELWTYNGVINYKLTDNNKEQSKKIYVQNDFDKFKSKWGE